MTCRFTIPCTELRRLYEDQRQGIVAIAACYGCSPTTISLRLRRCGIVTRDSRFQLHDIPADELRRLYGEEHWPIQDIARHFGVSLSTISNRRRAFGIAIRARSKH